MFLLFINFKQADFSGPVRGHTGSNPHGLVNFSRTVAALYLYFYVYILCAITTRIQSLQKRDTGYSLEHTGDELLQCFHE